MKNSYSLKPIFILLALLFIDSSCSAPDLGITPKTCVDTNCEDYRTQQEAQRAFEADPECRNDLDHDSDGIACEHLSNENTTNNCPTTANCGCSGKRKAQCQQDPCCKWIVGEGCKCN